MPSFTENSYCFRVLFFIAVFPEYSSSLATKGFFPPYVEMGMGSTEESPGFLL